MWVWLYALWRALTALYELRGRPVFARARRALSSVAFRAARLCELPPPPPPRARASPFCCDVLIVAAGADADAVALPLQRRLELHDVRAALRDREPRAAVVVVLSWDLVVERAAMAQLLAVLQRCEAAHREARKAPTLIPLFLSLSRRDCTDRTLFRRRDADGNNVFAESGFFERVLSGDVDMRALFHALNTLTKHVGVENEPRSDVDGGAISHRHLVDTVVERVLMAVDLYLDEESAQQMFERALAFEEATGGVARSLPKAMALYERVILACQRTDAMERLGSLLMSQRVGSQWNPERAALLLERAIREGNEPRAMNSLGALLASPPQFRGSVPADYVRAVHLFRRAIDEGDSVQGMANLALSYQHGEGVEKDLSKAASLYERAVLEGQCPQSCIILGGLLERGEKGVERDARRAVKLYDQAIAVGKNSWGINGVRRDVTAMHELAYLLVRGADGVEKDAIRAMALYERSIEEGAYVPSMYGLAALLLNGGPGVERDDMRAKRLLERAIAEGNDVMSMHALGKLWWRGGGYFEKSPSRAVELFEQAIRTGQCPSSMFSLAQILREGAEGVPQDRTRALELFTRAWEEGKVEGAREARDQMLAENKS